MFICVFTAILTEFLEQQYTAAGANGVTGKLVARPVVKALKSGTDCATTRRQTLTATTASGATSLSRAVPPCVRVIRLSCVVTSMLFRVTQL